MKSRTSAAGRSWDGWVLILGGLGIGLVLWLAPGVNASSRDGEALAKRDFDGLVHAISGRYQIHEKTIPMLWLVNVCARKFTHGGVQGLKVVEFEDAGRIRSNSAAPTEFPELIEAHLGDRWSPVIREREKNGEESYIYVQNSDEVQFARLIVLNVDGSELNMVSVSLNPDQLVKFLDEHGAVPRKALSADN